MDSTYNFKLSFFIAFLASVIASASANQQCKRYDKNADNYANIMKNTNYRFDGEITCDILGAFLDKLEAVLRKDDPNQVAELIHYPFNWNIGGNKRIVIKNKAQLKKRYKKIFTEKLKKIAFEGKVEHLKSDFMIDQGTIWFNPNKGIFAINQPDN